MRKNWSKEEIEYMTVHYPDALAADIAKKLGRPLRSIYGKAKLLGLSKSDSFYEGEKSGRLTALIGAGTRFRKGCVSWNKGKKMTFNQNRAMHHFPKGNLPHNTRENGYISIRANKSKPKYHWIRIDQSKWVMLHVKMWIDANGPVPPGYIVVFKNRNTEDCRIENLELITRKENMARNTLIQWPEELKETIVSLNKLKKLISNE